MSNAHTEGNPNSKMWIVLPSPAKADIIRNRMLQGQYGEMLTSFMQATGVNRRDCFLTTISPKSLPLGHYKTPWSHYTSKGVLTERGRELRDNFFHRADGCRPNVILTLGELPLAVLGGELEGKKPGSSLLKWRGSPIPAAFDGAVEVIPTFHPMDVTPRSGNYLGRYDLMADLTKAKEHSQFQGFSGLLERTHLLDPSLGDCLAYIDEARCNYDSHIAFDIECYNNQVSCMSFSYRRGESISIPFVEKWSEVEEMQLWRAMGGLLEDAHVPKVAHNAMFDVSFLMLQNKIHTRNWDDSMVAYRIMYPDFKSSLEHLTSIYTDHHYYKDDKKLWARPTKDPWTFWLYSSRDSNVLWEIWNEVGKELREDKEYMQMYREDRVKFNPCLFMMMKGIPINEPALKLLLEKTEAELLEVEESLRDASEIEFNPNSPAQCIKYFYGIKGLKPYINRKTGRPTTDDKALARIVRRDKIPEARLVQTIRGLKKLKSTYLELGYDADRRLRCFFNVRGTTTGRLSSSKTVLGTGMNMQNLDPRFKHFLYCDPDGDNTPPTAPE